MGVLDGDKPTEEQKLTIKKEKIAQIETLDAVDIIHTLSTAAVDTADQAYATSADTDNFSSDSLGPLAAEIFKEYVLQFKAGDASIIKMVYRMTKELSEEEE